LPAFGGRRLTTVMPSRSKRPLARTLEHALENGSRTASKRAAELVIG